MNIPQFRIDFPEFADVVRFPDATISFWSAIGEQQISADRFGGLYVQAVELFTAHNIKIVSQKNSGGALASKTVGSVSYSYDTASSMTPGAGHWNQTTYGRQYIQLARMIGAGCVQL